MTPRPSRKGDENALKALWREVFGDTDEYIDAFFQNVYQPDMASVIEEDGTVVAAAAVLHGKVRQLLGRKSLACQPLAAMADRKHTAAGAG